MMCPRPPRTERLALVAGRFFFASRNEKMNMLRFLKKEQQLLENKGDIVTQSFRFSWHYTSNNAPQRPFDLEGAVTPRAEGRRFDGAVDAYSEGEYIGRAEFSCLEADGVEQAMAQIRKRVEVRIEDRVAREATRH